MRPVRDAAAPAGGRLLDIQSAGGPRGSRRDQRSATILVAEAAVRSADLRELLVALAGGEPQVDLGEDHVLCPGCQGPGMDARILRGPSARLLGDAAWECWPCRTKGTYWSARRQVLEDVDALGRLIEFREAPA